MCGIAAILSPDPGRPVPEHALRRSTDALRHRGPDGQRIWVSPSGRAGLGHNLLAITDPEGHQPIASEDGRLHIVVNGQFYDYRRIRTALEAKGHRFRTRSDSEIALHLYEDLGPACLPHLRGQFAMVVWDEESGALFAARDRFGLKPLFYAEKEGRLYLASEAKALFAAGIAASWDPRGVYHALHACPDERISLFAGISQVPPGYVLHADRSGVRLERYWDLPTPSHRSQGTALGRRRSPGPTVGDAIERVRELTEESVALRMVAAVPVGCLLSGGLDSSAVLGVAASCVDDPVAAFTVGFERRDYDESQGAREAAAAAGAHHTVVTAADSDLADHFADAVFHAETIQYNTHGAARYLLSRGVRDAGYKSVLAGEGADEAFFGYEFLRAAAGAGRGADAGGGTGAGAAPTSAAGGVRRTLTRLPQILSALLRSPSRHNRGLAAASPWLARLALLLPAAPSLFTRLARGLGRLHAVCSRDFLDGFAGYDLYRAYYRRCRRTADLSRREPARRLLYLWLHSLFVNYHLAADRLDMAHGVEVRLPFLDHHLFEYTNSLPVSLLARHPREKHLLREAMRPYIPGPVYDRVKRPFMGPSAVGTDGPLHDFLQDTLRGDAMRAVPFLDHASVEQLLDQVPTLPTEDRPSLDSLLLMLASVAVLQERYRL
ncbi:MAG: asparagine synthase (glutamine-hydrolyzing) [Gemmatimonadota bacterium]|nr:asparagine synthase (glutamine-hydrolyzing) [Gemmatimonadota bacterium]